MSPEERFQKIEDTLLVTAEMQRTSEKRWNEQFSQLSEVVGYLAMGEKKLNEALQHMADQNATTQAALDSLIANIDRFLQGRGGNGTKP